MSEEQISCTPPELREVAESAINKLVPTKSRGAYEKEYQKFVNWCSENNVKNVTENVLLAYFDIMGKTKKSSTLWTSYSMLRTQLSIHQNVDISKFLKLAALLKRLSEGYQPKKSKILESEHIDRFINEAPDAIYLAMKIVLLMGYSGACRREELTNMVLDDINYKVDQIVVTVPKTKTNVPRLFLITNPIWIDLVKKYSKMRPDHTTHKRFFLNYQNGHCTVQPIGINKMGQIPRAIATFLNLPNPELFSGHCFRRSSASSLANNGGDLLTIKRHGGWKSSTVAEGYVEASLKKKIEVAEMLSTHSHPSTSTDHQNLPLNTTQKQFENHGTKENVVNVAASTNVQHTFQQVPGIGGITINAAENCTITINLNNCNHN